MITFYEVVHNKPFFSYL